MRRRHKLGRHAGKNACLFHFAEALRARDTQRAKETIELIIPKARLGIECRFDVEAQRLCIEATSLSPPMNARFDVPHGQGTESTASKCAIS